MKNDKIDKNEFFKLIENCIDNEEIKMLVEMLDRLWREDKIDMDESDWPILSRIVQRVKK